MTFDDLGILAIFTIMAFFIGHLYGYQSGKDAGIEHAESRHEEERKRRAAIANWDKP